MKKFSLYLFFALIFFGGITLSQIIAAVIYSINDGYIVARIADIPFLINLILAILLSAVSYFLIFRKGK